MPEAIQSCAKDQPFSSPAHTIPTISEQESNSSPGHEAPLAQLLLAWEGSVGVRKGTLSQDHNTRSHRALDPLHSP